MAWASGAEQTGCFFPGGFYQLAGVSFSAFSDLFAGDHPREFLLSFRSVRKIPSVNEIADGEDDDGENV